MNGEKSPALAQRGGPLGDSGLDRITEVMGRVGMSPIAVEARTGARAVIGRAVLERGRWSVRWYAPGARVGTKRVRYLKNVIEWMSAVGGVSQILVAFARPKQGEGNNNGIQDHPVEVQGNRRGRGGRRGGG